MANNNIVVYKYINIVNLFLLLAVILVKYVEPKQRYGIITPKGEKYTIDTLNTPTISPSSIISWAQIAITSAYTLNFLNINNSMEDLRQYFTKVGYDAFMNALQASKRLKEIQDKQVSTTAVINGPPFVMEDWELGKYTWTIQMPLLITYESASESMPTETTNISLKIVMVPTDQAETGLGINTVLERG